MGHFENDDEARGAFRLAYQQGLDGMGPSIEEWMGLTPEEFDAWMRDEALPTAAEGPHVEDGVLAGLWGPSEIDTALVPEATAIEYDGPAGVFERVTSGKHASAGPACARVRPRADQH